MDLVLDSKVDADWSKFSFSFLPTYVKGKVDSYGFEDWVYKMKVATPTAQSQTLGGTYGAEPTAYLYTHQVYWGAKEIRFHYPSENLIDGQQYDLEMQIFHTDVYDRHLLCMSGQAAVSLLFSVDDLKPNAFFDW